MEYDSKWLSTEEAADYLKTSLEDIEEMVMKKEIPHSVLPGSGKPLFSTLRLNKWLQDREVATKEEHDRQLPEQNRKLLMDEIIEKSKSKERNRSRYVNLYEGQKVYAQLHEPREKRKKFYDGVCIAIPEAVSDKNLPEIDAFDLMDIDDLLGFWGANKDWLLGNGKRFTNDRALAFHIPLELLKNQDHSSWGEVEKILKYAKGKVRSQKEDKE